MRQIRGLEVDVLVDEGGQLTATEVKSAATPRASQYANLLRFRDQLTSRHGGQHPHPPELRLIYGGSEASTRQGVQLISWQSIADCPW